ncbi:MAG: DUF1549 and DUF1553 domain-containing protein [Planctomycetia bacterium]|nr:DUF1549 and DUF1553 domain-containing protein [Planctomycetia bacterium]
MATVHCWSVRLVLGCVFSLAVASAHAETPLDSILNGENASRKVTTAGKVDDLAFLRRLSVDMIGRIPTLAEISEYEAWPVAERRNLLITKLLKHEGFADRWTVFLADMLRVRSGADGGAAMQAFVHKSVQEGMPYDTLCRQLIVATGRAGKVPEVGFVLGDNADPMALAGTTAQVFMGVRIACAQCHDHPFDVWKREQFYGMAAYFGKTGRRESELTKAIFAIENKETNVKWPPEGLAPEDKRKAMIPNFPFALEAEQPEPKHVMRLTSLRKAIEEAKVKASSQKDLSVDDLFAAASKKAGTSSAKTAETFDVTNEAKQQARNLQVEKDLYTQSQLRQELADLVTSPRNRYFSRAFVNRAWAHLMGRGIVEPIDDFSEANSPSHEKTLDFLADEFVAGGYDIRNLVSLIVSSDAYQRDHVYGLETQQRKAAEEAFTAMPARRMAAEMMFDSIVTAGHLFEVKHAPGENKKTIREIIQVAVSLDGTISAPVASLTGAAGGAGMGAGMAGGGAGGTSYDLESAIEVDFKEVLAMAKKDEPKVEMMAISNEDMEARQMMEARALRRKYVDKVVEREIDDNPKFASAMRMPSPAPPAHFLRVFGQPARDVLGDHRDHTPSMRQALMMLNGKMTHEASRVGKLEPVYGLLTGPKADLDAAIRLTYREAFTREPSKDELTDARAVLTESPTPLEGMSDLRWVLFNSHEFRFIP